MNPVIKFLLLPFSFIYGLIICVRNLLYDFNILKSKAYNLPVISIGNLSMGGTGKTPHIEYLIRLLGNKYKISTLSRGYKRKSKGFLLATGNHSFYDIGDEPLQYFDKYKQISVAVCENRCKGVENLIEQINPEVILLDDAFQHRSIKPGLNILLTDYYDMYHKNLPLPAGTLREFKMGANRADIIVVTKTPDVFSPILIKEVISQIKPKPQQKVYFSYIKYGNLIPINEPLAEKQKYFPFILLFSGIANPYPLEDKLKRICTDLITVKFDDHHSFTIDDLKKVKEKFLSLPTQNKIIVTTEKDAVKLKVPELAEELKKLPLFYVPIEIEFHNRDKAAFDNDVLEFCKANIKA